MNVEMNVEMNADKIFGYRNFQCSTLMEFKNAPVFVDGWFKFWTDRNNHGEKITNLSRFPVQTVNGYCNLHHLHLRSLHDIGRTCLKTIRGGLKIRNTIRSNVLGLLLIEGLQKVEMDELFWSDPDLSNPKKIQIDDLKRAITIVNRYLLLSRDVMECQEEMIQAGLTKYAKL